MTHPRAPAVGDRRCPLFWAGALALSLAGCSVVAGINGLEYDLDADSSSSTSAAASSGGEGGASNTVGATTTGAQSVGGQVSSTGVGASGTAGAGGSNGPVCGDGVISAGEECDDQNGVPDDGCDACLVICDGQGEFQDPLTHHCYFHSTDIVTQGVADADCAARGSTLAAISSQEEQTVIDGHIASNVNTWIGAIAPGQPFIFVWSNNEPWGYEHWLAGKPDNGDGNEHCVTANTNGLWDDSSCGKDRRYLCERAPAGMPQ